MTHSVQKNVVVSNKIILKINFYLKTEIVKPPPQLPLSVPFSLLNYSFLILCDYFLIFELLYRNIASLSLIFTKLEKKLNKLMQFLLLIGVFAGQC